MLSGVLWALFLVVEARTTEPMLDPHVLRNRTVLIASLSALLSSLGLTAISAYYPLFLQAVQGGSATLAGKIMTPFSVLVSFMGVPAGLLLGRTRRYKWMYVGGYAILTASLAVLARFSATTPVAWGLAVAALAGIGFGTIPTLNAMVVQYAVPRRLLGAAGGAFFFFVMMGRSVSPSILGSALDASYARELGSHLPVSVVERIHATSAGSSTGPGALLSEQSKREFEAAHQGDTTCEAIWSAVRNSLETALRRVFLLGAIAMGVSLLLIGMIPGNLLRPAGQERGKRQPAEVG
jgi:MFS family permease